MGKAFALPLLIALATLWSVPALYSFQLKIPTVAFAMLGCAALIALSHSRWRLRALVAFALAFGTVLAWWSTIAPSNDRDWKPEVAVLPYATHSGNRITLHNVRNFDYRAESDYDIAYYDQTVDLDDLRSVDLIASYWAGPAIAHVLLSFGFGARTHIAISIERRDERGEDYSTLKGLFRQYELFYVVADERDVIRLRTNIRRDPPEQVYLYRLRGSPVQARRLFMEYMRKIDSLRAHPEFYNTLTTNCTNNIWLHSRVNPGHLPYSWKVLLSGYLPEYLYEHGKLDGSRPFAELQRRSLINAAAVAADQAPDFSQRIRAGLPGIKDTL
ncbi:MAG TPA: DUF4105 domain-containing protein [Steroidobacteraceae bacterium]|nr:DUF4105 domain-containing protein [Steroidobacteraceae bacterium]